ncbi:SUMF1/EgtB/PvdO family nonheme iron enzyme [Lusitaniella coriacea LEGE 07167]
MVWEKVEKGAELFADKGLAIIFYVFAGIVFPFAVRSFVHYVEGNGQLKPVILFTSLSIVFAILGILTTFVSKILKRVGEKLEEPIADWIIKRLQGIYNRIVSALEVIGWKLSFQFRGKYYQSLIYDCRDYRTLGLKTKGEFQLDLEKVFVPLRVKPESVERISPNLIQSYNTIEGSSIWDFLVASRTTRQFQHMAIIGAPGSGKTTLLEHLTLTYAKNRQRRRHPKAPKLIPILLYLRDKKVQDAIADSKTLADAIAQQDSIQELNPPPRWFEERLRNYQCLVMLDGLDEVADEIQRKNASRWVSAQIKKYPKARFILTSRPFGYQDAPVEGVGAILDVKPFNLAQMRKFIENWYLQNEVMRRQGKEDPGVRKEARKQSSDLIHRIQNSPPLAAMALNPLLLTMIATVHSYRGALPGRRVELYSEICDVLLGRRQEAKGLTNSLTAEQKKAVLQVLALELMKCETLKFELAEGSTIIQSKLATVAGREMEPLEFLEQVEKLSGLLVEREKDVYAFAHKSFQEYLAAVQIKESNQETLLSENISVPWWDETIRLYAAQSDATNLIRAALHDSTIVSLTLALDCLEEGLSIAPEVREQLNDKLDAGLESTDPDIFRLAAEVQLARRLRNLLRIDENLEIDRSAITRAEFQLFLNEQFGGQPQFSPGTAKHPVTGIGFQQALGFCFWLSAKASDLNGQSTDYYRLPTVTETQNYSAQEREDLGYWTVGGSNTEEKGLRIVKTQTPSIFQFDTVFVNAQGQEVQRERRYARYFTEDLGKGIALEMVYIPGGTFMMGSPEGEGDSDEKPQHEVTVQPFCMGKFQVTQAQWKAVAALPKVKRDLKPNPSNFTKDPTQPEKTQWDRPVERVSWYDAVEFCARLSRLTGREYRLPSEAEWEYACKSVISQQSSVISGASRNPTYPPFHFGATLTDKLANYRASTTYAREPKGEYREQTTPVGSFPPNAFGLYDMHGNVWEWCADAWHENYEGAPTDGSAWVGNGNDNRSPLRGGSWCSYPNLCRSAFRNDNVWVERDIINFNIGFRVVWGVGRTH